MSLFQVPLKKQENKREVTVTKHSPDENPHVHSTLKLNTFNLNDYCKTSPTCPMQRSVKDLGMAASGRQVNEVS